MRARFRQISFSRWKFESAVFRSFRLADHPGVAVASSDTWAFTKTSRSLDGGESR